MSNKILISSSAESWASSGASAASEAKGGVWADNIEEGAWASLTE